MSTLKKKPMSKPAVPIQDKVDRLRRSERKIEEFLAKGGDVTSEDADVLAFEFVTAFDEVAKEFGYELLKPVKRPPMIGAGLRFPSPFTTRNN